MRLEMKVRRAVLKEMAQRSQRSRKKAKSRILEEFVVLTGYNRSSARWLLRWWGRKLVLRKKRWAVGRNCWRSKEDQAAKKEGL